MKFFISSVLTFLMLPAFTQLKDGNYRWYIERNDEEKIVFTTSVFTEAGKKNMYIINGNDSLLVDSISIHQDSVYIELPFFESSFEGRVQKKGNLTGNWVKKSAGIVARKLPFEAFYNVANRFDITQEPNFNLEGQWQTTFTAAEGKESAAIGEFSQKGAKLTGTFRTPYGDYRFLEGIVSGDSVYLSGFDGSYAILFKGKIYADEEPDTSTLKITGAMFSGNATPKTWESAKKEGQLELPQDITKVKAGAKKPDFSFPDVNNNEVSIDDTKYKNKVVVVQIMGSWCPNCIDEMKFIMENYNRYRQMGVEFIALAFERTNDFEESKAALQPFLKRFEVPYPVLIVPVAVSDEERTQKTLPQITEISAFPTTIFIGKDGNIANIHTGFDGPATGIHYEKYKQEFENTLEQLLEK